MDEGAHSTGLEWGAHIDADDVARYTLPFLHVRRRAALLALRLGNPLRVRSVALSQQSACPYAYARIHAAWCMSDLRWGCLPLHGFHRAYRAVRG